MPVFPIEEEITLKTWNDIVNRPRYKSPIEPLEDRYVRAVAIYSFEEQSARCGASDCLKAHSQGFLVVTSDEMETCLCEACGQRLLGVAFSEKKKVLQNKARIREQQTKLNAILQQSDVIRSRVKELKQIRHGANWLYRSLTNFRRTYPADLLVALTELATSKEDDANHQTLSESDADPSRLAQIEGLGVFATDIREVLIGNVLNPLTQLEEYAEAAHTTPSLSRYCQWADDLENQFSCAERLIEAGQAFFRPENMDRLGCIPLSGQSTRILRSLRWSYDKAAVKGK